MYACSNVYFKPIEKKIYCALKPRHLGKHKL